MQSYATRLVFVLLWQRKYKMPISEMITVFYRKVALYAQDVAFIIVSFFFEGEGFIPRTLGLGKEPSDVKI